MSRFKIGSIVAANLGSLGNPRVVIAVVKKTDRFVTVGTVFSRGGKRILAGRESQDVCFDNIISLSVGSTKRLRSADRSLLRMVLTDVIDICEDAFRTAATAIDLRRSNDSLSAQSDDR